MRIWFSITYHSADIKILLIINRQKVSLYEHADNLENDLTAMATGEWVDSGKVTISSCDISVTMVTTIDY